MHKPKPKCADVLLTFLMNCSATVQMHSCSSVTSVSLLSQVTLVTRVLVYPAVHEI